MPRSSTQVLALAGLLLAPGFALAGLPEAAAMARTDWAKAVVLYDEVLATDPGNVQALLRSAELLGWNKRPAAALSRYERAILIDPKNVEAIEGKARMLGWLQSGDLARDAYEQVLAIDPARKEAQIGLGWTEVWSDRASAAARISRLEELYPGDPGVASLRAAARRAWAPTFGLKRDLASDTGHNSTEQTVIDGNFMVRSGQQVVLKAQQQNLTNDPTGQTARLNSFTAGTVVGLAPGTNLSLRAGFQQAEHLASSQQSNAIGGAALDLGAGRRYGLRLEASRELQAFNAMNVATDTKVSTVAATTRARLSQFIVVEGRAAAARISMPGALETAHQTSASLGFRYRLSLKGLPIEAGYGATYIGHDRDLHNNSWMPLSYFSHGPQIRSSLYLPSGFAYWVNASLGLQRSTNDFAGHQVTFKNDLALNLQAVVTVPLWSKNVGLELSAWRNDGSIVSAGGWSTNAFGTRLVWRR